MNTLDVLKWGQQTALTTVDAFPESQIDAGGACGWWSVRQIVCHLTSFEQMLVDVLTSLVDGGSTPVLDQFLAGPAKFNDDQVAQRADLALDQVLDEFRAAHLRAMELAGRIPSETFGRNGALTWYGADYDLEDFLVYSFYGHKREHSAQINAFRDVVAQGR